MATAQGRIRNQRTIYRVQWPSVGLLIIWHPPHCYRTQLNRRVLHPNTQSTANFCLSIKGKPSIFFDRVCACIYARPSCIRLCRRVTYIVGYLPQELLGTSMYEYFHQDDISRLVDIHKATLQECKPKDTQVNVSRKKTMSNHCVLCVCKSKQLFFVQTYKFRAKDKTYVHLRSEWKSFRNPWTKDIEFIVANNILTK